MAGQPKITEKQIAAYANNDKPDFNRGYAMWSPNSLQGRRPQRWLYLAPPAPAILRQGGASAAGIHLCSAPRFIWGVSLYAIHIAKYQLQFTNYQPKRGLYRIGISPELMQICYINPVRYERYDII